MEQIAIILLVLTFVVATLKTSFFTKQWHCFVFAGACGVLIFGLFPFAIQQNKMMLETLLSNSSFLLNTAALLTVESAIFIGVNVEQLKQHYGERDETKLKWLTRTLLRFCSYFPGIIFIASLFYFEVQVFLLGLQMEFWMLALLLAVGIAVIIIILNIALKKLLAETELRLEMTYFLHFIQIILAAVIAAFASPNIQMESSVANNWTNILRVVGIALGVMLFGLIYYKVRRKMLGNK
jgi:hypothetical protein